MVDVPFVSEEFQRAYRNTFQGQVNSGRDLHVSDVVIPVVDFTPTASGTSISESLRFCRNTNTTQVQFTADATDATVIDDTGFFRCDLRISNSVANSAVSIQINDGSTNFVIGRYVGQSSANTNSYLFDNFNFFLRPQDKLLFSMSSLASFVTAINFSITPIADVNGNLINPSGYDPQ